MSGQSEELRAHVVTLYLPHLGLTVSGIPLPISTVGKLSHYSSICGSCNVDGAPVATVSPSKFVPV